MNEWIETTVTTNSYDVNSDPIPVEVLEDVI